MRIIPFTQGKDRHIYAVRAVLWSIVAAGWGLGVNIALQKGWLNQFPDLGVSALFIIPTLIFVYLAITHETVRRYYHLVRKYRRMTLLIFIAAGAVIGALGWYAIYKLPLQQPTEAKIDQLSSAAPESPPAAQKSSATPTPRGEKSIAAVSPPIAAGRVKGQISWNFSSFLGMSSGSPTGAPDPQFIVQTFQAFGRNSWSSTITKITGYVEIDGTGERFPLLFNKEGAAVDLAQMPAIENDERTGVVCYFTQDRSLWGSWQGGIETNFFLTHYTPFTFVVSINGEEECKYPFSTEECRALIQSFIDGVLRRRN